MNILSVAAKVLCAALLALCWFKLFGKKGCLVQAKEKNPDYELPLGLLRYDYTRLCKCLIPDSWENYEAAVRPLLWCFALIPGICCAMLLSAMEVIRIPWIRVTALITAGLTFLFAMGENWAVFLTQAETLSDREHQPVNKAKTASLLGILKWIALGLWLVALFASLLMTAAKF